MKTESSKNAKWSLSASARNQQLQARLKKDFYKSFTHLQDKDADQLVGPDSLMKDAPHDGWLNGTQKTLAERRLIDAQLIKAPFVVAVKKIGDKNLAFDAPESKRAIADAEEVRSKMFSPDGVEWVHSKKDMKFSLIFLIFRNGSRLGLMNRF